MGLCKKEVKAPCVGTALGVLEQELCEKSPSEWALFILQNLSEHLLYAVLSLWRQPQSYDAREAHAQAEPITTGSGVNTDRFGHGAELSD